MKGSIRILRDLAGRLARRLDRANIERQRPGVRWRSGDAGGVTR